MNSSVLRGSISDLRTREGGQVKDAMARKRGIVQSAMQTAQRSKRPTSAKSPIVSASRLTKRSHAVALAILCSSFAALALAPPQAFAQRTLVATIGANPGGAVAIDGNNNLWISENQPERDIQYSAYPSTRRISELSGSVSNRSIALNDSTGYLYAANGGPVTVEVFDNTGTLSAVWPTENECGVDSVAVNNSGTSSQGTVYIARTCTEHIQAVNAEDQPVSFSDTSAPYISANHITGTPTGPAGSVVSFGEIANIATDGDGNIYAVDRQTKVVDEFKSTGEFVRTFSGTGAPGGFSSELSGVAVDPTNGNVLIVDQGNHVVDEFSSSGEYLDQLTGFGELRGSLAVNAEGYVYVAVQGAIDIFNSDLTLPTISYSKASNATPTGATVKASVEPNGSEITQCYFEYGPTEPYGGSYGSPHIPCTPATPYSTQQGVSASISGLTSDTQYHYRAVLTESTGQKVYGSEQIYTPHVVEGLETEPATKLEPEAATLNASFTGTNEPTKYYFEWGTTPSYGEKTPEASAGSTSTPTPLSAELTGLGLGVVYHYRVVATNSKGTSYGEDESFTSSLAVPGLTTERPTNIQSESATLNGSMIGDGEPTKYYFEWGSNSSYGEKTPTENAGSPNGPEPIALSLNLAHLKPASTYHYRIVATDGVGTSYGEDQMLETIPLAPSVTESVSGVQSDLAFLDAKINPGGGETTYHFEYATQEEYEVNDTYARQIPIPDGSVGSGYTYQAVSIQLSDLRPGTTYHWRVVAENSTETTFGGDRTFTTYASSPFNDACPDAHVRQQTGTALLPDCRAYELVSAANTGGYDVESSLVEGETPYASYPETENPSHPEASARVLYAVHDGGIPGTNNPTNRGPDPYVATRGENGWTTEYIGVPANNPFSTAPFTSIPSGADASLDTFAFGSPEGCSPCFEGGYTGIPVHLPGSKEVVQGMVAAKGFPTPPPTAKPDGYIAKDLSANGEHLIFGSTTPFAEGGSQNTGDVSIYDRNLKTEETHLISNSPAGKGHPLACQKGAGECHSPGDTNGISELDISADGSHVLLAQKVSTDADANNYWHLYMNIGDSEKTIALTPDATGTTGGVLFDGMTSDGSKVFFSSEEHLTGEDTSHTGADIFMWSQKGEEEGEPLTLISTGTEGAGNTASCHPVPNSAHVHWNTVGPDENCGDVAVGGGGGVSSANGSIYFLSPEKLDGSSNGVQNAPNLYVASPGESPHFIATLESSLTGPYPPSTRHPLLDNFGSFAEPQFIAVDNSGGPSNGDTYVADTTANAIYKYNSSHEVMTNWGEHGKLTGFNVYGIAVGPTGIFYVFNGGSVFEFAQNGTLTSTVRIDPSFNRRGEFFQPKGMAVDSAGNFYLITEEYPYSERENVEKFSSSGEFLGQLPTGDATGVAVDPSNGDVYVINESTSIDRFVFNGSEEVFASELSGGTGLAVDSSHDVYFDEGSQVLELGPTGKQVGLPVGSGRLLRSNSVAVDSAGDVYATNPYRNDVSVFGPSEPSSSPMTDNPTVVDGVGSAGTRHTADFQTSPNGQFAVFPSTLPLTGFESSGQEEVYRYDAASESLACISCDPTGDEPTADSELAPDGLSLTDDGRVFFTTAEPLVERDADSRKDVYEWEPQGAGPEAAVCKETSFTFSRASGGCLDLISTGTSAFDSSLLGVSAHGTDVYFFSRDTLVSQAENSDFVKIYDARELGGFEYIPPRIPCKASDECHGPSSPAPPPPNINVNTGTSGNEVPPTTMKCRAGFVGKHGRCVKNAHRKHHKKHRRKGTTPKLRGKK